MMLKAHHSTSTTYLFHSLYYTYFSNNIIQFASHGCFFYWIGKVYTSWISGAHQGWRKSHDSEHIYTYILSTNEVFIQIEKLYFEDLPT